VRALPTPHLVSFILSSSACAVHAVIEENTLR
jgi:hypothetical protein